MSENENNYLQKLAEGNKDIIQHLYIELFPKITNFIVNNNGNQSDAEDIFQKVLLQLIARYKTEAFVIDNLESYIYSASRNLWRRELNKKNRMVTNNEVIELSNEADDMTLAILEQKKWELFQEKLDQLSDNCKRLLQFFFQKVAYKEIADKLGYNTDNVVRQRIFNCKSQLTKLIKQDSKFKEL